MAAVGIPGILCTRLLVMQAVWSAGALFQEGLLQLGGLVDGDDEQRRLARVPEAVRHLRRDDQHLVLLQLDHLVAGGPGPVPFQQHEGLRIRMDMQVDAFPGGVRTTNMEMPMPARGPPSKSHAVGLNVMSARSRTMALMSRP